jgi:hypothetical protein
MDLLKKLMEDNLLKNFLLVGGTALALKPGHRLSVDIVIHFFYITLLFFGKRLYFCGNLFKGCS